jgi:hypothetical protein
MGVQLLFFVGVKLILIPQVSDSVKHSKFTLGVFVDFRNYVPEIHRPNWTLSL